MARATWVLLVLIAGGCDLYFESDDPASDSCESSPDGYVMTSWLMPGSADESAAIGHDFDGDGSRDNQLAAAFLDIEAVTPWRAPDTMAQWLFDVDRCGDDATVSSRTPRELPGDGIAAGAFDDDGNLRAAEGAVAIPLAGLASIEGQAFNEWALGLAFGLTMRADAPEGRVWFAIWQPDVERVLAPALGEALTRAAAADPACAEERCWFHDWDISIDGVIAGWEVLRHRTGGALAEPDLDLIDDATGVYAPGADGIPDSHSFAVRYRAEPLSQRN